MFEHRIFVQVVANDRGNVRVDGLIVGHAGAERVGHADVAGAIGVEQAGNAQARIGAERQRIDEIVVDAAVNHIHAAQAGRGAHVDEIVVHHQIAAFHQLDSHLPRQKRVLEIGRIENARRQQNDGGLAGSLRRTLRRQRAQRGEQRLAIVLDGLHAALAEQIREQALHHLAAHQHVGDAAGHAQIVFEHHEFARRHADQIGARDGDIGVLADMEAAHLPAEMFAAIDDFPRHHAVVQNPAFVIDVLEEQIQRGDALRQAALDAGPFLAASGRGAEDRWGKCARCLRRARRP